MQITRSAHFFPATALLIWTMQRACAATIRGAENSRVICIFSSSTANIAFKWAPTVLNKRLRKLCDNIRRDTWYQSTVSRRFTFATVRRIVKWKARQCISRTPLQYAIGRTVVAPLYSRLFNVTSKFHVRVSVEGRSRTNVIIIDIQRKTRHTVHFLR